MRSPSVAKINWPVDIVKQNKICNLFQNTLDEIRRLAKFLGVSLEDSILEEISLNCQFSAMKKKYSKEEMDTLRFKEGTGFFRKGKIKVIKVKTVYLLPFDMLIFRPNYF